MIATPDMLPPPVRVLHKPKHLCGHGHPHRLSVPMAKGRHYELTYEVLVAARCVDCRRTFLSPVVRIPARFFITARGPTTVQQYVMRHGMAWIAHEAARP